MNCFRARFDKRESSRLFPFIYTYTIRYVISILVARNYKKKIGGRSYTNYTNTRLEEALSNVVEGSLSILTASKKMNTPYGTLYNRFNGKNGKKPEDQTVFSEVDEKAILSAVIKCGDWGFLLSLMDVR